MAKNYKMESLNWLSNKRIDQKSCKDVLVTVQPSRSTSADLNQSNSRKPLRGKHYVDRFQKGDLSNSAGKYDEETSTSSSSSQTTVSDGGNRRKGSSTRSSTPASDSLSASPKSSTSSSSSSYSSRLSKREKAKKIKGFRGLLIRMCKSSPNEGRLLKAVLWFPIGCIIALILYFLIIRKMRLDEKNKASIGAAVGCVLALSFAFSVQIRCTLSLVLPSFMGKAGRSYVTAFALIYLINGPITNVIGNSKEIVRSLTCTSALLANHSKEKWRLRLHPMEGALGDLTKDNFQLDNVIHGIRRAFAPLRKEIEKNSVEEKTLENDINKVDALKRREGRRETKTVERTRNQEHKNDKDEEDPAEKAEKEWRKKLHLRCDDVFSKGILRCRNKMRQLERKCMKALWAIGYLMCWPLKITAFCNIMKLLSKAAGVSCNSMDVVKPGFGETFVSARAVIDEMEEGMDVKMQYKLVGDPEGVDYTPVEEMRQATLHEVNQKSAFVNFIFSIISHVLTFTFLIVFWSAYKYNSKYLTDVSFDNVYITRYYKHIDARRKAAGKKTLMPLKKFEKKEIIDPMKIRLSKEEKGKINKGSGRLVLRIIIAAVICYMDSLLYEVLHIISEKGRVEYHQEGEHIIDIRVHGTGFMSALVRNFLLRFNTNQTLDKVTTNHHCLPAPEKTDDLIIGFIFGTYILVWVFMYFESFGLRMRHVIAGFFYRKREKKRVLHLYNEMFRRRIGYLGTLRKRIKKSMRRREFKKNTGVIITLQRQFPKWFKWLSFFKSAKETCIICEDSQGPGFYLCETPGCGIGYCEQCWKDVKKRCLACSRGERDSDDDDDDDEDFATDTSDLSGSE